MPPVQHQGGEHRAYGVVLWNLRVREGSTAAPAQGQREGVAGGREGVGGGGGEGLPGVFKNGVPSNDGRMYDTRHREDEPLDGFTTTTISLSDYYTLFGIFF